MANRCQALDIDGKRCKRVARKTANVHLHREIYDLKWVKVQLCRRCFNQLKSFSSFVVGK